MSFIFARRCCSDEIWLKSIIQNTFFLNENISYSYHMYRSIIQFSFEGPIWKMSTSSMFLILVLAVLCLTGSANSQYYPQTYGQSLNSRPSTVVLLPNQQSDISVVIIPSNDNLTLNVNPPPI